MEHKTRTSGFASMERNKQREIARKGGVAAHRKGTAHEFTIEEARNAGRKGGQQVSANRSHMIEIGRLGGRRSAERRRANKTNRGSGSQAESMPYESEIGQVGGMEEPVEHMAQQEAMEDEMLRQPGGDALG